MENKNLDDIIYEQKLKNIKNDVRNIIKKHANDEAIQNLSFSDKLSYLEKKGRAVETALKTKYLIERQIAKDHGYMCGFFYEIFPSQKELDAIIASEQYQQKKQPDDVFKIEQVPAHYQDNEWMKTFIPLALGNAQFNTNKDYIISSHGLHYFLNEATSYQAVKEGFETELVGAQIKYMMNCTKPNLFMDENSSLFKIRTMPNYDCLFRDEVKQTLLKHGIKEFIIENGLETYASEWRQQTMIKAFENEFYPFLELGKVCQKHDKWWHRLLKFKEKHQALWLKRREYDYYKTHKKRVDLMKSATENMKMDFIDLKALDLKLVAANAIYKSFMKNRKRSCILHMSPLKNKHTEVSNNAEKNM